MLKAKDDTQCPCHTFRKTLVGQEAQVQRSQDFLCCNKIQYVSKAKSPLGRICPTAAQQETGPAG